MRYLRTHSRLLSSIGLVAFVACGVGCAELQKTVGGLGGPAGGAPMRPNPPKVAVKSVALTQYPSSQMLAAHFCTKVAPALVCSLLGSVPSRDQLKFIFGVDLDIENTASIPLPLVEMLAAFTAFPKATDQQNLGAVCVSLCQDPSQCAQGGAGGCRSDSKDIRSLQDFGRAAANFLFAVATGQERLENLKIRTLPAGAHAQVSIRLGLDPDTMISLVQKLTQDAVGQAQRGQQPSFSIPYRIEGTIWVNVEHFGRIAASIPAYEGTWNL